MKTRSSGQNEPQLQPFKHTLQIQCIDQWKDITRRWSVNCRIALANKRTEKKVRTSFQMLYDLTLTSDAFRVEVESNGVQHLAATVHDVECDIGWHGFENIGSTSSADFGRAAIVARPPPFDSLICNNAMNCHISGEWRIRNQNAACTICRWKMAIEKNFDPFSSYLKVHPGHHHFVKGWQIHVLYQRARSPRRVKTSSNWFFIMSV